MQFLFVFCTNQICPVLVTYTLFYVFFIINWQIQWRYNNKNRDAIFVLVCTNQIC